MGGTSTSTLFHPKGHYIISSDEMYIISQMEGTTLFHLMGGIYFIKGEA